jgi:serine/threonine protein kinase/tetratricopeptide (TPR) repeat protein
MDSGRDLEIFTEAIQLPLSERASFLDRVCAADPALRQRIDVLIKTLDRAGTFLEQPPSAVVEAGRAKATAGEKPGDWVDRYKLLEQIGEGGCGVVFMAEQKEPVRRRVALKIIKPGMDTKSVIARFEAERQALALMDHPNICKIFDAGATQSGRPYFVMELVRGIKITDYCDQHSLGTERRLKLFVQICSAIQHAHQKGIIHRDIKPSNILVTTSLEGALLPVVIDFGIAKATTNQQLTDKTLFTAFEMLIGTPAYMSPEQAVLTSVDVDTRTDIYSLGVLLYELLAGSTPFDTQELLKSGLDEIRRIIREEEPVRPSTRLSKLGAPDLTTIAQRRQCDPPTLIRAVRGDLDWIVMKALEKDRTRRYETANGLGVDVQRYLDNEAILARPPGKLYKLQKTVLRNKLLFTGIGVIAVLLVVSLVVVSATLARERKSRIKSEEVTTFLKAMLNGAGPIAAKGRDRTMLQEILDQTAERLGKELSGQPEVDAELRGYIGKLYEEIGNAGKGEEMARRALEIRRKRFGSDSLEAAASLNLLGLQLMAQHKLPQAEQAHGEALAIRRRRLGDENVDTATSLNDLAAVYRDQDKFAAAKDMAEKALAIRERLLGPEHLDVADSLRNLAIILGGQNKWDEAEQKARRVLEMRRKLLLPEREHIWIASALEDVAWAASGTGNYEEALRLDEEALVMRQHLLGETHPDVGRTLNALGQLLGNRKELPAADAVLKATLSIQRKLIGDENRATLETFYALAKVLDDEGKPAEAEPVWREGLAVWRKLGDDPNEQRLFMLRGLADSLEQQRKWPDAETAWRESLVLWRKRGGPEGKESMYTLRKLGLALEEEHKWADAESVHREALALSRKKGDQDPEALADLEKLARVLTTEKKFSEAENVLSQALTSEFIEQRASLSLVVQRLNLAARRAHWQEAASHAALALKLQPDDHYHYHTLAALLAMNRDRPAYESICNRILTNFMAPTNPFVAERIVQDNLLLPRTGVDLQLMDRLADAAVTLGNGEPALPYFQACKAMSNYRLGRFPEAIVWAEKAANSSLTFAQAKAYAVLAMARWQLGQMDAARDMLQKGGLLAPAVPPGTEPDDLGESWVAWLVARISLDEAATLLQTASASNNNLIQP